MPGLLTGTNLSGSPNLISFKNTSPILPTSRTLRNSIPSRKAKRMLSRFTKAFLFIIFALFLLGSLTLLHPPSRAYINPWTGDLFGEGGVELEFPVLHKYPTNDATHVPGDFAAGGVIMGKLGNATAKAELGRATWKLLHTMTLRFPEEPTEDERSALSSYFHLLSRLYPCGECAQEFQQLLKKYPPQTSSRRAAATWLCHVHNQVNLRLHKPEFDCANLDATYDCGCGDDPVTPTSSSQPNSPGSGAGVVHDPMDLEYDPSKDKITGVGMIKGGR